MNLFLHMWNNWRKNVSMVVKMLILTGGVGLFSWLALDHVVSERIGTVFQRQLLEIMEQQASEDRLLWHEFLSFHSWAVTLLSRQEHYVHYVEQQEARGWMTPPTGKIIRHLNKPSWLPGRSVTRKLAFASHILLLDGAFHLREVYSQIDHDLADNQFEEMLELNPQVDGQNVLTHVGDTLHLVTTSALRGRDGQPRAWLLFVSPLNDDLLDMFQQQYRSMGISAFIDNNTDQVFASSRPDLVPKGSRMADLARDYHISGKRFLDHGFTSDATMRFATLIPLANLARLNQSVMAEERIYRIYAHLLLTLMFLWIVYWISRHIAQFVTNMESFARDELGIHAKAREGDLLEHMKEQFRHMSDEIIVARQRDAVHAEELEQANQALSQSLEMVQRAQAQLVQSEKLAALGGLVAGIAHEINTPAGIAFTSSTHLEEETQLIQQRYQSGEMRRSELENYFATAAESATLIQNNLNRATQLIRNFKMVAVDQASGERRFFNLKQYLEGVIQSLRPKLKITRVSVTIDCPVELTLDSFPGIFSQIFTNLVVNSLTHGYEKDQTGAIRIMVEEARDHVKIAYSDDGRGIPPEHMTRIFEPFYTTIRGRGGSGLGLHIVHNLVAETLRGTIFCHSEPGQGVTFIIQIPKEEADVVA